jgi:hypothetical protein
MAPVSPRLGNFGECLNCASFDFHDIFGFGPEEQLPPITFRDAFANRESCAFCRLLARTTRQFTPGQVVDHRDGDLVTFYFGIRHHRTTAAELGSRYLEVTVYPPPSPLDVSKRLAFHLMPISESLPPALYHRLDPDHIDLGVCRKWLTHCEVEHATQCRAFCASPDPDAQNAFRLIDVVDECVLVAPPGARYVALSYVWGKFRSLELSSEKASRLSQKGSLFACEASVARTIVDAINVVKALGERYLWVDRLCIAHDDPDNFLHFTCMDKIYGAALLTIVASEGADANAGLPGVNPGTRSRIDSQICEEVWPGFTVAATMNFPLHPADSVWVSRGWTFQEQLLSRRLLLFHQGSILWQCRETSFCEDAPSAAKPNHESFHPLEKLSLQWASRETPRSSDANQPHHPISGALLRPAVFTQYAKAVEEYTRRSLTFPDDVVHAFEGIAGQLGHHIGSTYLAALPETYLDVALLWIPLVLQSRRGSCRQAQLPSWSWAGWVGQAGYAAAAPDGSERIELISRWYVKDGSAMCRLANKVGIGIDGAALQCSPKSHATSWTPAFDAAAESSDETPTPELPKLRGPYLQFWTSCSFFNIVHRVWRPDLRQLHSSASRPTEAHIHCARGTTRQLAGYLVLNGNGPTELTENKHEFVVLSGAKVQSFDSISGDLTYSDQAHMYNVMLVEWDGQHQVASRLGIGRIFTEAWDSSLPTSRFVTIG